MTFLNQVLVFGAAAFAIPLIIHILNRSRFRTVEWGAMHLLESVIKVNHRRFRIDQLILLLVRCSIPVLLALCLARPVLTGSATLEGDAPVSLMVLLDTSYSMDASAAGGTRYEQSVDAASEIISRTARGSEISVILTGGKPTPLFDQPVYDSAAVVRRLKQQQSGLGASDTQASLDEALAILSSMKHARRELVIISDFQPADWQITKSAADDIRQQIAAMAIRPGVTLLQRGTPVSSNISVDSLEFPNRAIGVGQRMNVRAVLHNHGTAAVDQVRVVFKIDGDESEQSQVSLAANSSTQILFPCVVSEPGSHTIEVDVKTDDLLPTDNRFAAAIQIWDRIQVVLVDGDPSGQPLKSETDFLAVALTPFTFGRVRLADLVETRTIRANALNEESLKNSQVVVLANVPKLDDSQVGSLKTYVEQGGALLVTPGNRIDLNWWAEKMYAHGTGLLPAAFGEVRGEIDEQKPGSSSRIVMQKFDHPALEYFNTPANGDLAKADIRRWHRLEAKPVTAGASSPSSRTDVIATLTGGDPFLMEQRVGDGVVFQLATACDADWSDLPMRPFFVPLMQQIITTMASGLVPPRNIPTGEPAVALLSGLEPKSMLSMLAPDGTRRTLKTSTQGNREVARFETTQRPGVYTLSLPSTDTIHFVAETSRAESDLGLLDDAEMTLLAKKLGATVVESSAEYIEQDELRRFGREIWRPMLVGLLSLLFLEVVLQQRFARVRV